MSSYTGTDPDEPFPVSTRVRYAGSQTDFHDREMVVSQVPPVGDERGYIVSAVGGKMYEYVMDAHRRSLSLWEN